MDMSVEAFHLRSFMVANMDFTPQTETDGVI